MNAPRRHSVHVRSTLAATCISLLAAVGAFALDAAPALAAGDANTASCPASTEESPGFRTYLPDCRAYEQVSPSYKGGHLLFYGFGGFIAPAGSQVFATSFGAFAGAEDSPGGPQVTGGAYQFSRIASGWRTTALSAPGTEFANDEGNGTRLASPDLSRSLWVLVKNSAPQLAEEIYVRMPDGTFSLVGPMISPADLEKEEKEELPSTPPLVVGASHDLAHVFFRMPWQRWPGDNTTVSNAYSLYETTLGDGAEPKLVAVRNAGPLHSNTEAQLIGQCGAELESFKNAWPNPVSASGEAVFFTVDRCFKEPGEPEVNEVYARFGGEKTLAISSPDHPLPQGSGSGDDECDSTCAAAEHKQGVFEGATENGSKVFFTTAQPLLNSDTDNTADLYEAQIEGEGAAAKLSKLTLVSKGDASDPTPGEGAEALGTLGFSHDGSRVYFAAEGKLTTATNSQGQEAAAGVPNLYMVEPATGRTVFIASLSPEDSFDWDPRNFESLRQLTPNGRFLVFASGNQLTPDDTSSGLWQFFEFDAQTESLVRVSIGSKGFNDDGNTNSDFPLLGEATSVAEDGAVFFSTSAALTPDAYNDPEHLVRNVYEYRDGNVYLISDGKDTALNYLEREESAVHLWGADPSGENVFFATAAHLVPSDGDTQPDVYDARVNGGFPAAASPPPCQAEACQGAIPSPPSSQTPGTSTFSGPPSETQRHGRKHKKAHHKKKHKRAGHKRGGDK